MSTTTLLSQPPSTVSVPAAPRRLRLTTAEIFISVTLLLLLGVVSMVDGGIISSLLTPIKNDLRLADEQFTRITALGAFLGLWANPIYGYLGNKFGRRRIVFGGLLLLSLSEIASGLATNYGALLISRILVTFGGISYLVLAPSWIADLYAPQWRNFVFTIYHLKNRVGVSISLFLGGFITARYDWHAAFIVTGAATLALIFLLFLVREPKPGEADGHIEEAPKEHTLRESLAVFKYPGYVLHVLAFAFFSVGMHGQQWIPAYLYRTFHITNQAASGFLGTLLLATIPVGLLAGWLTGFFSLHRHRGGYAAFLGITSSLAAIGFFIAYHVTTLSAAQFWLSASFTVFALSVGSLTTLIVETVPPRLRTSAAGWSPLVTGLIASVVVTEIWGLISDRYGLGHAILLAPTGYLLGGLLWLALALWQRSQPESSWLAEKESSGGINGLHSILPQITMSISRRDYIRTSVLGAAALAVPETFSSAASSTPTATASTPVKNVIDWHNHWISPAEIKFLSARTKPPRITINEKGQQVLQRVTDATADASKPFPLWPQATDIEGRLRHLDQVGVQRQIISYTVPFGYDYSLSAEEIRPLFQAYNDDLAGLVQKYPDRFSGYAALPTSDVAWAVKELERAHRELGLIGGSLPLNAFSTLEGAQVLAPIFAVAQKYRSHIFVHRGAASSGIPGQPEIIIPKDTAYARWSLISDSHLAAGAITLGLSDFLEPYPDVTVEIVMLGGSIPYVIEHIQQSAKRSGQPDPINKLRRLYLDPGPYSLTPRSIVSAVRALGADRILFGSDYGPNPDVGAGIKTISESGLTPEELNLIFVENGRKLLAEKGVKV
jgi:predicted TIM-barrel fold metal-dependent hydrolase/MFS family permease